VCILISFIDELFEQQHLDPKTISGYVTGVKDRLLTEGYESEALGRKGVRHPWVARAIRSCMIDTETVPAKPPREEFTNDMMLVAFQTWPLHYYAMAILARGWLWRSGQFLVKDGKWGEHILFWSYVTFFDQQHIPIPVEKWCCQLAYFAKLQPEHTKCHSRDLQIFPERRRTFFPESGAVTDGLIARTPHGCVVAVLQAWYVFSGAASQDLRRTPLCRCHDGSYLSADEMLALCHQMERTFQLRGRLVIHSLRHGGISALMDAGISDKSVCSAAGMRSVDSLRPYHHCGPKISTRLSRALIIPDDPDAVLDEWDMDCVDDDDNDDVDDSEEV
jgi:hypothetical protein